MEGKIKEGRLLIVDDNKSVLNALRMFLKFEFAEVYTISSPNSLVHELETLDIDIVLLDMNFKTGESPGNEGMYWLREIKQRNPDIEVVMFTAYGDVETAVKAEYYKLAKIYAPLVTAWGAALMDLKTQIPGSQVVILPRDGYPLEEVYRVLKKGRGMRDKAHEWHASRVSLGIKDEKSKSFRKLSNFPISPDS